uniref:Uncharacterized protein n=1 Tax=Fagus sylvatica TaxID=28930 RepID=A0A2N9J1V1_FAGSY
MVQRVYRSWCGIERETAEQRAAQDLSEGRAEKRRERDQPEKQKVTARAWSREAKTERERDRSSWWTVDSRRQRESR